MLHGNVVNIILGQFNLAGNRGLAVLVTCDYEDTPGVTPLMSTRRDADEMRKTFKQFEYGIVPLPNREATRSAINALVKQLSDYMKGYTGPIYNADGSVKAIVFYFSGRGKDGDRIVANNNKILYLEDIVKPLVTHELIGDTCDKIPKLFMIDACRGNLRPGNPTDSYQDDSRLTQIVGNFRMEFATTEGYLAYGGDKTWSILVAEILRECNDTYQNGMSMVRQRAFQELKMQQSQMIDQLTVGPFQLYYHRPNQSKHLSVVNCLNHICGSDCYTAASTALEFSDGDTPQCF